ncbi:peptidase M16 domain protein [Denitrovibrio acetiphilus DSM 12809]|uniref:Peptidase M16 domain protein n=1 Tax=Denitrovibrio acetiphilus (strain DSM 12809 / NBRC 114555 / N2460) TaxID=522772 RepID=D4H5Z5_DENA2|nr:pitrilysin family protein [Denitrovibrio acetiphilus]ADD67641.1 peptidase M16 domain protein [Denitrovibrio acetiphilus DSM 12809]
MIRKLLIAVFIIVIAGGNVLAQQIEKLDNGLTLIYKQIPNVNVVSVQAWIKTGSVNETQKENGISHFLEHMVFKGTDKFAPGDIDSLVESSGGVLNAATSKDYTFYYVTAPSHKAEVAFDTISEMVFHAKFIPEEIAKEKPVVVQEIKRKFDRPTAEMWTDFAEIMFGGTPYSREVIGTEDNVNAFTRDMLVDYYNRYYHPENMTLVVVGDTDFKKVRELADKYFSYKRQVSPGHRYSKITTLDLKENIEKTISKDLSQEYGIMSFPAEGLMESDVYSLEVLGEALSGGEFSALNLRMKYNNPLVNSITGGYYGVRTTGCFIFTYNAQPGRSDEIKSEILKIINDLSDILTDETIEKAKNRLKSQSVFQREKSSSEANDIGYSYTVGRPDYYHDFLENMNKVSKKSIMTSVKNIFDKKYLWLRTLPDKEK